MPHKKEHALPPLNEVIAKYRPGTAMASQTSPEAATPTPEEPKFYGTEFARLIETYRKMGTLRERASKRAGMVKGMRLMGHVHPDAKSPATADIPLVILDVYHGRLTDIYEDHKLAFMLDGFLSEREAINVLKKFYPAKVTPQTEIDYFTFIQASVFDQLPPERQALLLQLSVDDAIKHPDLGPLFYPSLCQTLVWHDGGLSAWIEFLELIGTITPQKAESWRKYRLPSSQTVGAPVDYVNARLMQDQLDIGAKWDERLYDLYITGNLDQFEDTKVALEARYHLVPCLGNEQYPPAHELRYAIVDQLGNGAIDRWVDEQEADYLITANDADNASKNPTFDQTYAYTPFPESSLLCPDCQPSSKAKPSRKRKIA